MKQLLLKLFTMCVLLASFSGLNAQIADQYVTHHFNDGQMWPFVIPKADQEARVNIVNRRVETHWDQSVYNGTNSGRKAQFRPLDMAYTFTQEFWTGFYLKIHGDYMRDNTNTNAGLMQIWGFDDNAGSANWMTQLKFDGRNGGALCFVHRLNGGSNKTESLVYSNFPKDQYVRLVMHIKFTGNGTGIVQIWIDDVLKLDLSNTTIGWGDMNANGMINQTYCGGISYGQYNYMESATTELAYDGNISFDGHMSGETRTVTYDLVSLWNGPNGYDAVNPSTAYDPSTGSGDLFQFVKRNATGFAVDGNNGGANGQNVYMWSESSSNANQQWVEIDRGNGYYSYQKNNTNYCLDGGNGGSNGQSVYLWTCGDNNQNQHWNKVDAGNGHYRLEKRNASGYSIDGGNGGADGQDLYLWDSNHSNQNQHFRFDGLGSSSRLEPQETIELEASAESLVIFPNPIADQLNIQTPNNTFQQFEILTMGGKLAIKGNIEKELHNFSIDVSKLDNGVYMLSLKGVNTNKTIRLIKD